MTPEVNAYLQALPDNRRARITGLIDMIAALYPDALLDLKYRMPTFSQGDGSVSVGSQEHYVSLYACSAEHLAAFRSCTQASKVARAVSTFAIVTILPWTISSRWCARLWSSDIE